MNKQRLNRAAAVLAALLFLTATSSSQESQTTTPARYAAVLRLIQARDYQKAFVACQRLIEAAPQMELAYRRLVEIANVASFWEEAEKFFNELALQTPRQNALRHYSLASLYSRKDPVGESSRRRVIEHCQQSLSFDRSFAKPYILLVDSYLKIGKGEEAKEYLNAVLKHQPNSATTLYGLSHFHRQTNDLAESLKYLNQALTLAPDLLEALYIKGTGLLSEQTSEGCRAALEVGARLLLIADQQGDLIQQSRARIIRGVAQDRLGQLQLAIQSYQEGLQYAESAGELELCDYLLSLLCGRYAGLDDYANALTACRKGLSITSSKAQEDYLAHLGFVYRRLGDTDSGVQYYVQALTLAREKKLVDSQIWILTNLGETYIDLKRYGEAEKLLNEAIELADKSDNLFRKCAALASLGKLHYVRGDYPQALAAQKEAKQIAKEQKRQDQEARSLRSLGLVYEKIGDWQAAIQHYQEAIQLGEQRGSSRTIWLAHSNLAALYRSRGQLAEAEQHYHSAIHELETTRQKLKEDGDKVSFWQDKVKVYKDLISLLMTTFNASRQPLNQTARQQTAAEAFHLSESWRARAFLDLVAEAQGKAENDQLPSATGPKSVNKPISLAEARERLDNQTVVLAYSLGERESFLFVLGRHVFAAHKLPNETIINESATRLIQTLADKQQLWRNSYWQTARALYGQLIGPAEKQLAGKTQLIIVGDGILQRLPFEALLKVTAAKQAPAAPNEWPYLIKDFAISYAPSVSIWANLQARAQQASAEQRDFIAFGDPRYAGHLNAWSTSLSRAADTGAVGRLKPLEYSSAEVKKIASLFTPERVRLFLDAAANEENVKAAGQLSRYRFIHFSVHATMNETEPRFSGLMLSSPVAPDHKEDGVLTANEIFNLHLNADLVSLSACETGLGKEVRGEGLMGLMRAFIYAGTPSVLVSLWKVDDAASADLMTRFYEYLLKGKEQQGHTIKLNKAQALRQAQLAAIQQGSVPYFWAPFVLVGKP
jgi:CHAT domain-containing protein/Tfp pilus assembly protein PilF